jgi:hypothetical protein
MKSGFQLLAAGAVVVLTLSGQEPAVPQSPADLRQMGDRSGKFKPGDMAPDFTLKVMHKETEVALSSFRNQRPVALVFGSYT